MSQISMKLGGYQGAKSVHTRALARFADAVEAALGDRAALQRVFDVTAHGETARSLFDGLETGAYTAGYMASGYLTARIAALGVADLPFAVADRHAAYAALDGAVGEMLSRDLEAGTGLKLLGFWDNGFRHVSNSVRPIRTRADCEGLVVRTLDNRIYQETMAAMGFTPVVTDVRELKAAVAEGRVHAQENPLANVMAFDLQQHHRHVSLTGHLFGLALLVCNRAWFDALDAAARDAVLAAAADATASQRRSAEEQDATAIAALTGEGIAILAPGDIDLAGFRAACAPIVDAETARLDPALVRGYLGG